MTLKDYRFWITNLSQRELRVEQDNLQSIVSANNEMSKDTKNISKAKLKVLMDFIGAKV